MTQAVPDEDSRVLLLEGVHNFRDCGGYALAGGGRLRRGRLYRSGEPGDATAADLDRLAALGLSAIVDLRSDRERRIAPSPWTGALRERIVFVADAEVAAAPRVAPAQRVSDARSAALRMGESYAGMAFRPAFRKAVNLYFHALARAERPVLVHCMAGKDRTGVAVALLHRALGVSREDWLADYLMTNVAGDVEARIAAGARRVRTAFGHDLDDAAVRVIMSARPAFIDGCFAAMDARHGGPIGYLEECGVDEALMGRLRERLVG